MSYMSPPLASGARWLLPAAPDLGREVSPPGRHCPRTRGSFSQPRPLTLDAGWLLPAVPVPSQPGTLGR